MNDLLSRGLKGELKEYRSIPFWSWNNALDENELINQIEQMKSAGIGGFIMHARTGLADEYLGEKWFSCIGLCLEKAKELGLEAWIYDENGWPSGFVGGKLLENETYRARFLEYRVGKYDESAFAVYIEDDIRGFRRVETALEGVEKYHNIYLRVSPANTDVLNPEVVEAFIRETHERYYARFAKSFGRELAGFFTDEPQYYRWATPYTHCAEGFFTQNGENIRDGLIWLFIKDKRGYAFRQKYYGILNHLYVENFYKKIYEWCETHNCKLTGHSIEEGSLVGQMLGGAAVSPTYEFEHIPAIDWLGKNCCSQLAPKQASSVAAQLGKKTVLTETFACCGYDVTPKELKSVAEAQYFNGVNKMCQHLYPYSIAGQGKIDHPPVFSPQGNWFEGFGQFNRYFARLGYIIANTKENCDIALISPVRDIWLDYIRSEEYASVRETEDNFDFLLRELRRNGITFQLIDERILQKYGSVEDGCLRVGQVEYRTVVVPQMRNMCASTYALLRQYTGKLCVLGAIEYIDGIETETALNGNTTMEQIKTAATVKFHAQTDDCFVTSRSSEIGEFLFVKNLSSERQEEVIIENAGAMYVALDLNTLTTKAISDRFVIEKNGSIVLLKDEHTSPTLHWEKEEDITSDFSVMEISENYLVMDRAQMRRENGTWGQKRPIQSIFDTLLRENYKGNVSIRHVFTCNDIMPVQLIMEKQPYRTIRVNGKAVFLMQSRFDINFLQCDIGAYLRPGENTIEYELDYRQHEGVHFALFDPLATESLRNCLYYDVSIEPAYLKGNFVAEKDGTISKCKHLPPLTSALHRLGYPFFKGTLTLKGCVTKPQTGRTMLQLNGRFLMAQININGKKKSFVMDNKGDITDLLKDGENEVEIKLFSSLRNLFGPHHYNSDQEPYYTSPDMFTMRGEWKDELETKRYTSEYCTVPFGVDRILLKTVYSTEDVVQ